MRLRQSLLVRLNQPKQPQRKFLTHLFGLLLMRPGHVTFRNLSRSSPYQEKTFARWYARGFEFVALNKAAITEVGPAAQEQAFVMDASVVSKSGKQTYGLDRFWNGTHSRAEKGLDISALGWLDITDNCAYSLSVEHTPPTPREAEEEEHTRIDTSLAQLTRVVQHHDLSQLPDGITDGYSSNTKVIDGVRALKLHQRGKLRADAHLRYLYDGPQRSGPGRPKTYDGKVRWTDLSRFERLDVEDHHRVLYHPVVNHGQFRCHLRVVLVVDTQTQRRAVLFSTDVTLHVLTLYRSYKARFQVEFLFREAKQWTGLSDCQARSKATLDFHCKASLTALTLAKLEARQQMGSAERPVSMASLKRRACTQHLIDGLCAHCANGHSLEKASPASEQLCHYATSTESAA